MFSYTIETEFQFDDRVKFTTDNGDEGTGVIYMMTLDYEGQLDYGVLLDGENVVHPGLLHGNLTLIERADKQKK